MEVFLNYPDIDEYTAETFHLLGNLFRERGEVDRALRVHQNVIARSNINAKQKQKAMFALGQDFFAAGMLDRAESVFLELQESNNKWISKTAISESLRTIYEQTQEWQKAIETTLATKKAQKKESPDTIINADSLISHYYCELADDSLSKGNLHEVDLFIAGAKKHDKQSTRLMSLQGDIDFHQKKYKSALNFYLNAVKKDSRLLSMLFNKLEETAEVSGKIPYLQKELLTAFNRSHDKNIFEALLQLSKKHVPKKSIDDLVDEVLSNDKLTIKSIYKASEYVKNSEPQKHALGLIKINQSLENHLTGVPTFRCEYCGYKMHDYLWRCPACNKWDTVDQA